MGTSDIVFGGLFGLLSIVLFALTLGFPTLTVALSPTVFPRFVSTGMFLFSAILTVQGIRKRAKAARRMDAEKVRLRMDWPFVLRFILLAADSLLYLVLLEPIGYILTTPPCIAAAMLVFGERRWLRIVLASVAGTAIMYAVFRMLFRVPLPRSPLW